MKTVVFIEKPTLGESFDRAQALFKPYQLSGEITVVYWSREEFLPGAINDELVDALEEGEHWRAIVVADLSHENLEDYACEIWRHDKAGLESCCGPRIVALAPMMGSEGLARAQKASLNPTEGTFTGGFEPQERYCDNPFDIALNFGLASYPPSIQDPVVKLSQMLAGLPAHVLDEHCAGVPTATRMAVADRIMSDEDYLAEEDDSQLDQRIADVIRGEFEESTRKHYSLSELALKCGRPDDLIMISFRDFPQNVPHSSFVRKQGTHGSVLSEFSVRNHYADQARFIVVDRERGSEAACLKDEHLFWCGVLVLAVNTDFTFELAPYYIHTLEVGMDYERYTAELEKKYSYTQSAYRLAEERLRQIDAELRPDEAHDGEMPSYQEYVALDRGIRLDDPVGFKPDEYGWLKDTEKPHEGEVSNLLHGLSTTPERISHSMPARDEIKLERDRRRIDVSMQRMLDMPRDVLREATRQFRGIEPFPEEKLWGFRLNERQTEKLERDLQDIEQKLAGTYSLSIMNPDVYKRVMETGVGRIKKRMKSRAYLREVALVAIITIVAAFIAFTPYVLGLTASGSQGATVNSSAGLVSAVVVIILLVVGALSLKTSQRSLKNMLADFNDILSGHVKVLHRKVLSLIDRVSDFATYRKGYSLLAQQHLDNPPRPPEALKINRNRVVLERRLAQFEEEQKTLGRSFHEQFAYSFDSWSHAEIHLAHPEYFYLMPEVFRPTRPFNASLRLGIEVEVPYDFINWIEIKRVPLYEDGIGKGDVEP